MNYRSWIVALAVVCTGPASISAQPLLAPKEVTIYVHQDVENRDFVDQLVCALSQVLVAPVRAQGSTMPIDISLMSPTGELDAARVIPRFVQELPTDSLIFNFLIIPYDLRSGNVRHTFGTVYGLPYNSGVVSLAYLTVPANAASKGEAAQIVMQRTYKIILRYIAHTAGLWERNGCVLAWPHGVAALDSKPSDFCDDDKARLIESRILKSQPGGACTPIALHTPIRPVEATASR